MKVPYRKDNLHSSIDWERFFELQSGCNTKVEMIHDNKREKLKLRLDQHEKVEEEK